MALKVKYTKQITGFPDVSAMSYCRVEKVNTLKNQAVCSVIYFTEKKTEMLGNAEFSFVPSVVDGSKNHIAQAYEHLKTLPDFVGAIDY
jgi:hypothetical protein